MSYAIIAAGVGAAGGIGSALISSSGGGSPMVIPPYTGDPEKKLLNEQLAKLLQQFMRGEDVSGLLTQPQEEIMNKMYDLFGYRVNRTQEAISQEDILASLGKQEKKLYNKYLGKYEDPTGENGDPTEEYINKWIEENIPETRRFKTTTNLEEIDEPTTPEGKMMKQTEGLIQDILSGNTGEGSILANSIINPMRYRLQEEVMPQIGASYGKGGAYFGTHRAAAETKATQDTEMEINKMIADLQQNAMQTGLTLPLGKLKAALGMIGNEQQNALANMAGLLNQYLGGGDKAGVVA